MARLKNDVQENSMKKGNLSYATYFFFEIDSKLIYFEHLWFLFGTASTRLPEFNIPTWCARKLN